MLVLRALSMLSTKLKYLAPTLLVGPVEATDQTPV